MIAARLGLLSATAPALRPSFRRLLDGLGDRLARLGAPLHALPRLAFAALVVRPVLLFAVGLNVRGREHLPRRGPAILAPNHNSHLDALALASLYPLAELPGVVAAGAADYFFRNAPTAWLARHVLGAVPVARGAVRGSDPLAACSAALAEGRVLIFFPEGSRGEPERMQPVRSGLARLAAAHPEAPVVPVYLRNFGRVLPRGDWLPVPVVCDVVIGRPLPAGLPAPALKAAYAAAMAELAAEAGRAAEWD